MEHLFNFPVGVVQEDGSYDFSSVEDAELSAWISASIELAARIGATPDEFTTGDDALTRAELMQAMTEGVAALEIARTEFESRQPEEPEAEIADDAFAALAAQAAEHAVEDPEDDPEAEEDPEAEVDPEAAVETEELETEEVETAETTTVVAAGARTRPGRPRRSRRSTPVVEPEFAAIALTAAAENLGFGLGQELGSTPEEMGRALAKMMIRRQGMFGTIPEGTHGDKVPIAKADWSHEYPEDRKLHGDPEIDSAKIEAVVAAASIKRYFDSRRAKDPGALVASGGLCAPVTPYYGLQVLATAARPVRAALPGFNADRGGINNARPAGLPAITTGVGIKTMAEDAAGGTEAQKTCQRIDCPEFTETLIQAIYHCLEFGNVTARTFPELLAQWNQLVVAAQARTAETALLDGINDVSTQVTAASLGLGATATLPSHIVTAAAAYRNRNRMDAEAVLRVMLPAWVLDLLVSDIYRSQFQRFEMSKSQFVALLRANNIEPTFYIDGDSDGGQVFGAQGAGALLNFPDTIKWYLYAEGSFLFLDGGTLEIGLVRDSVLNNTNDFQIFGETFENVAFIGIESLAVTTTTCDSGTVSLPHAVTCPIDY